MIITVSLNPAIDRILDVPGFRAGRTLMGRVVAVVPAGKGLNVSRYLDALGVPSVAAAFVGERERAFYEESLAGTRVTLAFVPVASPTRVHTTILGERGRPETHIRVKGFAVTAANRAALARVLRAYARPGNTFVFSGSPPNGFSPAAFARLLRALARPGAQVVVDASGPALRAAARAGVDVLSPNEDELREVTGARDALAGARRLLKRVGAVAVKRGAKGGLLVTREGAWSASAPVPRARVRNTVGAGDAFLAGFLAAREKGASDADCLSAAVAAGAAAVSAGVVGQLDLRALARALAQAEPHPIPANVRI